MHTITSTSDTATQTIRPAVVDTNDRIPRAADALRLALAAQRVRLFDRVAMRVGLWLVLQGARPRQAASGFAAERALRVQRIHTTIRDHEQTLAHHAPYPRPLI